MLTGLDESCEGDSAESFDLSTYYTARTYITTGQQQPIIQSQKCVPGMKCSADGGGDHRATSTGPTQLFNANLERKTGKNL